MGEMDDFFDKKLWSMWRNLSIDISCSYIQHDELFCGLYRSIDFTISLSFSCRIFDQFRNLRQQIEWVFTGFSGRQNFDGSGFDSCELLQNRSHILTDFERFRLRTIGLFDTFFHLSLLCNWIALDFNLNFDLNFHLWLELVSFFKKNYGESESAQLEYSRCSCKARWKIRI